LFCRPVGTLDRVLLVAGVFCGTFLRAVISLREAFICVAALDSMVVAKTGMGSVVFEDISTRFVGILDNTPKDEVR